MRGRHTIAVVLCLATTTLLACQGFGTRVSRGAVELTDMPSWEEPIARLFDAYCNECHSDTTRNGAPNYFRTDSYEGVGSTMGVARVAELLAERAGDPARPMPPPPAAMMSADELAMLRRWIDNGLPRTVDEALSGTSSGLTGSIGPDVPRCEPGTVAPCACHGGYWGRQTCLADGTYDACGCGDSPGTGDGPPLPDPDPTITGVTLARVHGSVFAPGCAVASCHDAAGSVPPDLANIAGLRDRLLGSSSQAPAVPFITPGDAARSYLYLKTLPDFSQRRVGYGNSMPVDLTTLDDEQRSVLRAWIDEGAQP